MFPDIDPGTLATIASIISAFGTSMLVFRIQRELEMRQKGEQNWIAWADWLLVSAVFVSLLLVIVPLLTIRQTRLPAAGAVAAAIMVAGYVPAILAHYRLVFGRKRTGQRVNPEPWERFFVAVGLIIALFAFVLRLAL
jgi:hypothetical protein